MPDGIITRPLPRQHAEARFMPDTLREGANGAVTVDMVFTTGAVVPRFDVWSGTRYDEELVITPEAVDLGRLNAGAPILRDHQNTTAAIVGSVVPGSARIVGGQGVLTATLSTDPEDARTVQQVREGHLRHVSVGYIVRAYERIERQGQPELWRAVAWEPVEVSLVAIPADAGAGVRAAGETHPCTFTTHRASMPASQEPSMTEQVTNEGAAGTPAPANITTPTIDTGAIRAKAALAERARIAGITARGQALGVDAALIQAQIDAGTAIENATDALFAARAANSPAPIASARVELVRDAVDTLRTRLSDAFQARMIGMISPHLPQAAMPEHAREFAQLGFHGMIRELLMQRGHRDVHRMDGSQLFNALIEGRSMHTTSDFIAVLGNSVNKSVRIIYEGYPRTWGGWTQEIDVADFKTITAATLGMFPEPRELLEGQEIRTGSIAEDFESYQVIERARIVALSRAAIINDDTRALQDVIANAALGGYNALRRVVFGILTANANMRDAIPLFNAGHGNLGTAGALNSTTFSELRALLGKQTAPARSLDPGETAPYLPPPVSMTLLVGPDEARAAQELVSNLIVPTQIGTALPQVFRQQTTVIEEGFLDTGNDPYYLARNDMMRAIEIAYLAGNRAPQVMTAEQFDVSGASIKVMFDFGAKAVTWRGIAGNLG
jgi:phage head maturation protease